MKGLKGNITNRAEFLYERYRAAKERQTGERLPSWSSLIHSTDDEFRIEAESWDRVAERILVFPND
jgi:hypothetical protein